MTNTEAWNAWLKVWNGQSILTIVPMVTAKASGTPPGGMQENERCQNHVLGMPLGLALCRLEELDS